MSVIVLRSNENVKNESVQPQRLHGTLISHGTGSAMFMLHTHTDIEVVHHLPLRPFPLRAQLLPRRHSVD